MEAKTLALYLGCKMKDLNTHVPHDGVLTGITECKHGVKLSILHDTGFKNNYSINRFKLLLRPLSSMTEEETVEFKKLVSVDHIGFSDFRGHQTWQYWEHEEISNYESRRVCKTTSEIGALPLRCIQWLLSKGFDLFELIEKNEAIDSTKL